jgi:hypothetical protein
MKSRPAISWKRHGLPLAAVLVLVVAAVVGVRKWQQPATAPTSPPTTAQTYPGLNLEDPAASYETLRYVADTGGDESTRAQAIVWLDQQTRTMQPLSPRQEAWMLDMLTSGGHPQWDKDYKFWLFNSAFNTLHLGPHQEDLTRLLKHLAVNDPEKTMRLYAIQHLEVQRTNDRLTGPLAEEVRAIFLKIAAMPDGQEAGLAIRFLAEWDGTETPTNPDVIAQALELASADSRSVDVRVTALHAAGSAALPLARTLAPDDKQPMLVRKAAISCIGQHGGESDTSDLQKLAAENSRLAQAADPARQAIHQRLANPNAPALIPF